MPVVVGDDVVELGIIVADALQHRSQVRYNAVVYLLYAVGRLEVRCRSIYLRLKQGHTDNVLGVVLV